MFFVTRPDGEFRNTVLAAPIIGVATLRNVQADNAGTPFGLACSEKIDRLLVYAGRAVNSWSNVTAGLPPDQDFEVRLV